MNLSAEDIDSLSRLWDAGVYSDFIEEEPYTLDYLSFSDVVEVFAAVLTKVSEGLKADRPIHNYIANKQVLREGSIIPQINDEWSAHLKGYQIATATGKSTHAE